MTAPRRSAAGAPATAPAHWLGQLAPLALAALALAGLAVAAVPQHTTSILRLLGGTLAGCAAMVAVTTVVMRDNARPPGRPSPLDRPPAPPLRAMEPPGLAAARRAVTDGARPGAVPLSVAAWERLASVAVAGFARTGIDVDNPATREEARRSVSPAVWQALTSRPTPPARPSPTASDAPDVAAPAQVAAAVERVLDELGPST